MICRMHIIVVPDMATRWTYRCDKYKVNCMSKLVEPGTLNM